MSANRVHARQQPAEMPVEPIKTATAFAISIHIVEMMRVYLRRLDQQWVSAIDKIEIERLRRR